MKKFIIKEQNGRILSVKQSREEAEKALEPIRQWQMLRRKYLDLYIEESEEPMSMNWVRLGSPYARTEKKGCATPIACRNEVAEIIRAEHGDSLTIEMFGDKITLGIRFSSTGATWWYHADITKEQYLKFANTGNGISIYQNYFGIIISKSLEVNAYCMHRKSDNCVWKSGYSKLISPEYIIIQSV